MASLTKIAIPPDLDLAFFAINQVQDIKIMKFETILKS